MQRRSLLTSASTAALLGVFTAGCMELLGQSSESAGSGCAPEYREIDHALPSTILSQAPSGLLLRLSPSDVTPPEPVTATLENTADTSVEIYDTDRLAVQWRNSSEEWTTVLGVSEDYSWNDATTSLEVGKNARVAIQTRTRWLPGPLRALHRIRPRDVPVRLLGASSRPDTARRRVRGRRNLTETTRHGVRCLRGSPRFRGVNRGE